MYQISATLTLHLSLLGLRLVLGVLLVAILTGSTLASSGKNFRPPDLRFQNMPLCFEHKVLKHYKVEDPPTCARLSTTATTTFSADVFEPEAIEEVVTASACTLSRVMSTFTWYFFGSEQQIDHKPQYTSVTQSMCHRWKRQYRDLTLGRLIRSRPGSSTYTTRNPIVPKWSFASTETVHTKNAILVDTALTFNTVTGKAQHAFDPLLKCSTKKGYCESDQYIYIFTPFDLKCAFAKEPLWANATVFRHDIDQRKMYQIPRLDLAFSSLYPCPNHVSKCYQQYPALRCTATNFIIALHNATEPPPSHQPTLQPPTKQSHHSAFANVMAQSVTSLSLNHNRDIHNLKEEMLRLHCQNARVQLTNLRSTQIINPSAALSVILNKPAYATMGSNTLQEIACVKVSATLKPSLWVGDRLASNPIFYVDYHNTTREAQLTRGGYLRWKLRDFMPRNSGFIIFTIGKRNFAFLNGSLQERNIPSVINLGLPDEDIPKPDIEPDPEIIARMFDAIPSPLGLDYIEQQLSAIHAITSTHLSARGIDREAVLRFTDDPVTPVETSDFLNTLHDVFTTPFPLLHNVFKWATFFWVSVATLGSLYLTLTTIIRNCRENQLRTTELQPQSRELREPC